MLFTRDKFTDTKLTYLTWKLQGSKQGTFLEMVITTPDTRITRFLQGSKQGTFLDTLITTLGAQITPFVQGKKMRPKVTYPDTLFTMVCTIVHTTVNFTSRIGQKNISCQGFYPEKCTHLCTMYSGYTQFTYGCTVFCLVG